MDLKVQHFEGNTQKTFIRPLAYNKVVIGRYVANFLGIYTEKYLPQSLNNIYDFCIIGKINGENGKIVRVIINIGFLTRASDLNFHDNKHILFKSLIDSSFIEKLLRSLSNAVSCAIDSDVGRLNICLTIEDARLKGRIIAHNLSVILGLSDSSTVNLSHVSPPFEFTTTPIPVVEATLNSRVVEVHDLIAGFVKEKIEVVFV